MTAYARYPYETLISVGTKLGGISDDLNSSDKGASDVGGLGADQSSIADGIHDFRSEWGESVKKLKENIGTFGQLSGQIGTMVSDTDHQLATAMKPKQA
jgi:hypothetical protein